MTPLVPTPLLEPAPEPEPERMVSSPVKVLPEMELPVKGISRVPVNFSVAQKERLER